MLKGTIILVLAYVATVYAAVTPNLEARVDIPVCNHRPGHPDIC